MFTAIKSKGYQVNDKFYFIYVRKTLSKTFEYSAVYTNMFEKSQPGISDSV